MGKKILVTGSRGLLGSTLLKTLTSHGYEVVGLDVDVGDKEKLLDRVVNEKNISWIIHTAAKTDVGACEKNPEEAYRVNGEGTGNVVEAARTIGARLIYISTASVFSGLVGNYKEGDVLEPNNVYNKSKVLGEQKVSAYDKGMILRLNIIGVHLEGSRGKNFMEWLVDSFKNNEDMNLFNDSLINPLSNWTIVEFIELIIKKDIQKKILHLGSRDVLSKAAIGKIVNKYFPNYSGEIREGSIEAIADGVVRPKQMWLNTEIAQNNFGIKMPTLETELELILKQKGETR